MLGVGCWTAWCGVPCAVDMLAVETYLDKLIAVAMHSSMFSSWRMTPDKKTKFETDIMEIHTTFKEVRVRHSGGYMVGTLFVNNSIKILPHPPPPSPHPPPCVLTVDGPRTCVAVHWLHGAAVPA